jgi:HSP20 family protein
MNLIPWKKKNHEVEVVKPHDDPTFGLTRSMADMVNDLFRSFDEEMGGFLSRRDTGWDTFPQVDISETDQDVTVSADFPGLSEKDIKVELDGDYLILKGERKHEHEDKKKNYHRIERSYGSFHRTVALPEGTDPENVNASFKNGELKVRIAKLPDAKKSSRRIEVNAA